MARLLIAAFASLICSILLLPAFLVAAAMWLFSAGARAIGRLLEPRSVPWTELIAFDPRLGWRPRANLDARYLVARDDVFHVITDSEGWPGSRSLDDSAVVVIGDSFAFGYGVDVGRGFADLNPGLAVKGVGSPGYSMVQSVLLMEQLSTRLTGKLVVWFVCLENDLEDNLAPAMWQYRSPFARLRSDGTWEIASTHVTPAPWRSALVGRTRILPQLCVPGPIADRTYDACDYLIGRAADACRAAGARLALVTVPDPSQLTASGRARLAELSGSPASCDASLPDRRIGESCARHGVGLIAGKDRLSDADYKRIEGLHWNERGHRRVAGVLGDLFGRFKSGELDRLASTAFPMSRAG